MDVEASNNSNSGEETKMDSNNNSGNVDKTMVSPPLSV